jgi:hypothetical protein
MTTSVSAPCQSAPREGERFPRRVDSGSRFHVVANSLAQLLETARRELERDRATAKASLATASSILRWEIERWSGAILSARSDTSARSPKQDWSCGKAHIAIPIVTAVFDAVRKTAANSIADVWCVRPTSSRRIFGGASWTASESCSRRCATQSPALLCAPPRASGPGLDKIEMEQGHE